ncbi:spore cortex-lytic enzyme [Bacillus cereus]|uniref:Spore cortex-lytic enzyme n=1 Tax=Bacillus cereus TaxID=1396 RepID=A0A2B0LR21_BACCE|nr:spore cortex-lytic enzyme [Bacillus cereus]
MRHTTIVKVLILFVLIGISVIVSSGQTRNVHAFSNQVIQRGASGEDVIELQSRLKYNGFYTGKVDGVFGWGTYWALRNFQQKFGLPVDGLAGSKTKQMLVKATKYEKSTANKGNTGGGQASKPTQNKGTNVPNGYSQNDIQLMANAVYGESRGEPYLGQVAVAAVILNRVTSASFPNTVSGVIFEPRAFTAVADGQIYLTPNETAKKAVLDAINGWDPTGNALYYFNPDTATSKWIWSRPQIKKIGKHIFCK